jgi:hypothetical protein
LDSGSGFVFFFLGRSLDNRIDERLFIDSPVGFCVSRASGFRGFTTYRSANTPLGSLTAVPRFLPRSSWRPLKAHSVPARRLTFSPSFQQTASPGRKLTRSASDIASTPMRAEGDPHYRPTRHRHRSHRCGRTKPSSSLAGGGRHSLRSRLTSPPPSPGPPRSRTSALESCGETRIQPGCGGYHLVFACKP